MEASTSDLIDKQINETFSKKSDWNDLEFDDLRQLLKCYEKPKPKPRKKMDHPYAKDVVLSQAEITQNRKRSGLVYIELEDMALAEDKLKWFYLQQYKSEGYTIATELYSDGQPIYSFRNGRPVVKFSLPTRKWARLFKIE